MTTTRTKYQAMYHTGEDGFTNFCHFCGELFDEHNPAWNTAATNLAGLHNGGECWRCAMIRKGWKMAWYKGQVYLVRSNDLMLELEDHRGNRRFVMQFEAKPLGQDARCRHCGERDATVKMVGEGRGVATWICNYCGKPWSTYLVLTECVAWPEIECLHSRTEDYFDHGKDDIYMRCLDCGERLEVD